MYQEENGCFLCGEKHKIKFLCSVKRSYRKNPSDDSKEIFEIEYTYVLRFLCLPSFKKRKKTGKKIQYTITVIPSFLVPYSVIPLNSIITAIVEYDNYNQDKVAKRIIWKEAKMKPQAAAAIMLAKNIKTFYLHRNRIIKNISEYNTFLREEIIKYGGKLPAPKINSKPKSPLQEFEELATILLACLEKIPETETLNNDTIYQYIFFEIQRAKFTTIFWYSGKRAPPK